MGFAERMKTFKEDVDQSCRHRTAAVKEVSQQTTRLLSEARATMQRLGQENKHRADQLHASLAASTRQRQEEVRQLRQDIAKQMHEMRTQLHGMLEHTRQHRQESVHGLLHMAQTARTALGHDLREAGKIWRGQVH